MTGGKTTLKAKTAQRLKGLFKKRTGIKKNLGHDSSDTRHIPELEGKYKYDVVFGDDSTGSSDFSGECVLKQDGRALVFNGEQREERKGLSKKRVSFHWFSTWAELCEDNKIRMDYFMSNQKGGLRAYLILESGKTSRHSMSGEFHLLHEPHTCGTVTFKPVKHTTGK